MSKKRDIEREAIEHQDNLRIWYKTLTSEEKKELWDHGHFIEDLQQQKSNHAMHVTIMVIGIIISAALVLTGWLQ